MTPPALVTHDPRAINGVVVSARQAIDMICDRWTLLIILALLLGERRFTGITDRTGMASRLLTSRLKTLEENGLVTRVPYSLHPLRFAYRLTPMGLDLKPVILHMRRWDQAWAGLSGAQGHLAHTCCDSPFCAEVLCRACGRPAGARDIQLRVIQAQLQSAPDKGVRHRRSILSGATQKVTPQILGESLDIFGDKWGIEILLCSFLRIKRFNDVRQAIGIAGNILSDRLDRLVAAGLFVREEGPPTHGGYRLTEKGVDCYAVTVAIYEWADRWVRSRYKPPVALIHAACGQPFWPDLSCRHCRGRIQPSVMFDPGSAREAV